MPTAPTHLCPPTHPVLPACCARQCPQPTPECARFYPGVAVLPSPSPSPPPPAAKPASPPPVAQTPRPEVQQPAQPSVPTATTQQPTSSPPPSSVPAEGQQTTGAAASSAQRAAAAALPPSPPAAPTTATSGGGSSMGVVIGAAVGGVLAVAGEPPAQRSLVQRPQLPCTRAQRRSAQHGGPSPSPAGVAAGAYVWHRRRQARSHDGDAGQAKAPAAAGGFDASGDGFSGPSAGLDTFVDIPPGAGPPGRMANMADAGGGPAAPAAAAGVAAVGAGDVYDGDDELGTVPTKPRGGAPQSLASMLEDLGPSAGPCAGRPGYRYPGAPGAAAAREGGSAGPPSTPDARSQLDTFISGGGSWATPYSGSAGTAGSLPPGHPAADPLLTYLKSQVGRCVQRADAAEACLLARAAALRRACPRGSPARRLPCCPALARAGVGRHARVGGVQPAGAQQRRVGGAVGDPVWGAGDPAAHWGGVVWPRVRGALRPAGHSAAGAWVLGHPALLAAERWLALVGAPALPGLAAAHRVHPLTLAGHVALHPGGRQGAAGGAGGRRAAGARVAVAARPRACPAGGGGVVAGLAAAPQRGACLARPVWAAGRGLPAYVRACVRARRDATVRARSRAHTRCHAPSRPCPALAQVNFYGFVREPPCIVTEFAAHGSLAVRGGPRRAGTLRRPWPSRRRRAPQRRLALAPPRLLHGSEPALLLPPASAGAAGAGAGGQAGRGAADLAAPDRHGRLRRCRCLRAGASSRLARVNCPGRMNLPAWPPLLPRCSCWTRRSACCTCTRGPTPSSTAVSWRALGAAHAPLGALPAARPGLLAS